jgi:hypothetical protein
VKDPVHRLCLGRVLDHPWMEIGAAPEISLDVCYMSRIRDLALSRRMREFFDANMGEARVGHPLRRQHMAKLLPWLNRRPTLTLANDNCEEMKVSCRDRSNSVDATQQQQQQQQQVRQLFLGRLTRLKRLAVTNFEQWHNRSSSQRQGVGVEVEVETKGEGQSLARMRGHDDEVGIDLDAFLSMVQTCDLPELASRQVFEIFDIDGSGIIRYRTHSLFPDLR